MKVKIEIPLCMGMMLNHHSHPYVHSTAVLCDIVQLPNEEGDMHII